jgi:hypothetical protein
MIRQKQETIDNQYIPLLLMRAAKGATEERAGMGSNQRMGRRVSGLVGTSKRFQLLAAYYRSIAETHKSRLLRQPGLTI